MNESQQTNELCLELRKFNAQITVFHGNAGVTLDGRRAVYQTPGVPDRFVAHNYLPGGVWLEFKANKGKLSGLQQQWIQENTKRGVHAFVIRHGANTIEDATGNVLGKYDGTARDLLLQLRELLT